ncbi:MAG: prohibitin family protein [Polyangiaceae bacterium]|nr:prohibitin family protein [Polyangiaceae bacterium]
MRRLILALALLAGCANETTPEGFVGYVYHVPLAFGKAGFVKTQRGPTSTGVVWRQFLVNVDIRAKNYTEEFHILSRDNLTVGFEAHARIAIRPEAVRTLIESIGSSDVTTPTGWPEWYTRAVRQPFRSAVRDVVHEFDAYDIQTKTQEISGQILSRLREEYVGTPIELESISIGNLTYPAEINAEIQRKLAAEQDLERMDRERQIAEQEAQIVITNARGRAAAQRIVNETLTPLYVQHEMLEGFQQLSRSDRVTIIAAPTGDSGGSSVVLGLDR